MHKFDSVGSSTVGSNNSQKATAFWAEEAIGWATTHEQVTGSTLEPIAEIITATRLPFSKLFNSCAFPNESVEASQSTLRIYFADSSRTRRDVIAYVFNPLLGDIFAFNMVYTVFDALGIRDDSNYMLQCFGEWFMLLSGHEIAGVLVASSAPMVRFLKDLAVRQFQNGDDAESGIALGVLHAFCRDSCDLVRAFMLAAVCREAVSTASALTEKASYGKYGGRKLLEDWDSLLRKLRVCLLVSLRLNRVRLAAPLSVDNVDQGDIFSVYEWLAHDELSMSHNQEEIALLENACSISSYAFDPSTPAGDGPSKFKVLQNSCLASQISEQERAEYLVDFDDDDRFGALLLFLGNHNDPPTLAAHRALLLSLQWTRNPRNLDCLHDSYFALDALYKMDGRKLTAAVCIEVWQRCSLVFRAHLFGFHDIQGINEEDFAPLLQTPEWLVTFGRIALNFLGLIRDVIDVDAVSPSEKPDSPWDDHSESWPPVKPDVILERLVGRLKKIERTAIDNHSVVICALLVSKNVEALVQCVPTIYDSFLPSSLTSAVPKAANATSLQNAFVEEAIVAAAVRCPNRSLDRFNLDEIETLAHVWKIDSKLVRSKFLLAMYELEKDRAVDDLVLKSPSHIDVRQFVEHGVDVACHRLCAFLNGDRLDGASRRNVMGVLDADVVDWVEQRSDVANWLVANAPESQIPISSTRLLVMRLLSLSVSANIDQALRAKIHSLALVSGHLMKEITGTIS